MRLVIQRVTNANVSTESRGIIGSISKGLCVLVGIKEGDGPEQIEWFKKTPSLILIQNFLFIIFL